ENGLAATRHRWQTAPTAPGTIAGPDTAHAMAGPTASRPMIQAEPSTPTTAIEVRGYAARGGRAAASTTGPSRPTTASATSSRTANPSAAVMSAALHRVLQTALLAAEVVLQEVEVVGG